jgi:steroid delta-isomerase-like uncharacterized protein
LTAADVVRKYFDAIARQDLDAAADCWIPGGIDHLAPVGELRVPDEWRAYFSELFAAIPDFAYEVVDVISEGDRVAVRWRARGTFTGGRFQGIRATGATLNAEGIDWLLVEGERIRRLDSYWDDTAVARQIGVLPAKGSRQERMLKAVFNARTSAGSFVRRRRERVA